VIIALAGVAAETGVVMLVYFDEGYERWVREGRLSEKGPVGILLFRGCSKRLRN
jgi:Cu(I)/Ag(I) efflux system membrane protein CusA/SilA